MVIKQVLVILVLASVLGLGLNLVSPHKISYIGHYRSVTNSDDPIVPPEVIPGDPPFIAIDVAQLEFNAQSALFVDAREPEEFNCGTIPGAINIPFDHLPETNLGKYIDSALGGIAKDHKIITFCSGEECDLSLHLARNLQALGYDSILIFFGGAREWEKLGLQMERRTECGG
ncbi:MAG: rhodanese-like domain-containing protein [Candidatus Zixiibacteriota bacterium]